MSVNEGTVDRMLRVVVGLAILSLAFVGPKTMWAYLGLVPLLKGLAGFCPVYVLFGVSTCKDAVRVRPQRTIPVLRRRQ